LEYNEQSWEKKHAAVDSKMGEPGKSEDCFRFRCKHILKISQMLSEDKIGVKLAFYPSK